MSHERLSLRVGTTAGPGEVLIAGPFHPVGCACCGVRSPLAALGRVWREHAMGKPVAGAVVAMDPDALARAYAADSLAQARFRLVVA
ncbi:MAG: hypothetical protein KGK10_08980 [Rhodospirillales bacterium]|nr:hypothetical protein [Rhodospirillales bacterium]